MKLRVVAVVIGVVGLLGMVAPPAGAVECVPILYPHCGQPVAAPRAIVHQTTEGSPDDYKDKLLKYVPAEVLGGFVALAALAEAAAKELQGDKLTEVTWPLITVFVIGLLATPGYLAIRVKAEPDVTMKWYGFLLALLAFVPWALAASFPVRDLFGVTPTLAEFLLAVTVFIMPILDLLFGWVNGLFSKSLTQTTSD